LKLSDEQVARLTVASAKTAKGQATAAQPVAKKPETLVRATPPAPLPITAVAARAPQAPPQHDDVGLILARMERHE
jgi:hypothetical protein